MNADIEKNIMDQFIRCKTDDEIDDVMTKKFGIVFLKFNSMDEMIKKKIYKHSSMKKYINNQKTKTSIISISGYLNV